MPTPSQPLMPTSADQFRLILAPSSVDFAASSVAQSATRPGLSAGFGTAMPLEHCSANVGGVGGGVAVGAGGVGAGAGVGGVDASAGVGMAVGAGGAIISGETAMPDANASSVRAVVIMIARLDIVPLVRPALGQSYSLAKPPR